MNYRLAACTLLFVSAAFAQFETAEVLGTVHDASGGPVPKAAVTLINQGTGAEAKTTTGDDGGYDFANVKVGLYTVNVEATGFNKVTAAGIDVKVQARQRVDLTLQVGAVSQSVQPYEFRAADCDNDEFGVWDDPEHVRTAADSVCSEADFPARTRMESACPSREGTRRAF